MDWRLVIVKIRRFKSLTVVRLASVTVFLLEWMNKKGMMSGKRALLLGSKLAMLGCDEAINFMLWKEKFYAQK